jgi:hypothetical protein
LEFSNWGFQLGFQLGFQPEFPPGNFDLEIQPRKWKLPRKLEVDGKWKMALNIKKILYYFVKTERSPARLASIYRMKDAWVPNRLANHI